MHHCILTREINIVGVFFAFDWPSKLHFTCRNCITAEIIIATKASCDKKCITNEINKAVQKRNNPHKPTIIFWGSFEGEIFNFLHITILNLYFVSVYA